MKRMLALGAVVATALAAAGSAFAHAHISPLVALAKEAQLFSLDVPTEKEGVTTTKIVLTCPPGFSIDSFVAAPGWKRDVFKTGTGENAVVAWSGGNVPTDEISHFAFIAEPQASKTYTFSVKQTYSDGSVVDWSGPESSDTPAPAIEAKSSLGGGSTLALVAVVVGAVGIILGGVALVARGGGRELA